MNCRFTARCLLSCGAPGRPARRGLQNNDHPGVHHAGGPPRAGRHAPARPQEIPLRDQGAVRLPAHEGPWGCSIQMPAHNGCTDTVLPGASGKSHPSCFFPLAIQKLKKTFASPGRACSAESTRTWGQRPARATREATTTTRSTPRRAPSPSSARATTPPAAAAARRAGRPEPRACIRYPAAGGTATRRGRPTARARPRPLVGRRRLAAGMQHGGSTLWRRIRGAPPRRGRVGPAQPS